MKNFFVFLTLGVFAFVSASFQTLYAAKNANVTFRVKAPKYTPATDTLYIVGDNSTLGNWNPGKATLALTKKDDFYEITLAFSPEKTIMYKFTRGNWKTVEKDKHFGEINNRVYKVTDADGQVVEDTVVNWRDFEKK